MARFLGWDASPELTAVCVVDETGRRLWRGQCATDPAQIERTVRGRREGTPRLVSRPGRRHRGSCMSCASGSLTLFASTPGTPAPPLKYR